MNQLSNRRRAGVLLHISSLPSGDLGQDAWLFVDLLESMGATVWQTLPLNMTHADGSPYQCLSAHAGNPHFISLDSLVADGWLTEAEAADTENSRELLFEKAYISFANDKPAQKPFKHFCKSSPWLDDFSLFLVLRHQFQHAGWMHWPETYKNRDALTMQSAQQRYAHEIAVVKFTQYVFFKQWHALKAYANSKQVSLFGDIPIFVAYDSAEVWAEPTMFKLDEDKNMTVVAGVPPDYFSATGQRWGNPHYNWQAMQLDGFSWWLSRMHTQNDLFDLVRIDHFRGLEAAWEIPAAEETAMIGEWVLAPGDALLRTITEHFPNMTLIAEDLGIITDEVNALREKYHLAGMKILQFAFDGSPDNPYLPERITPESVVYTGTHDNDTTLGWYLSMSEEQRRPLHAYLHQEDPEMPQALMEMALASASELAIIPMQDILLLDSLHRMNIPGTVEGNWQWRFDWEQLQPEIIKWLCANIKKTNRVQHTLN